MYFNICPKFLKTLNDDVSFAFVIILTTDIDLIQNQRDWRQCIIIQSYGCFSVR